jgi:hypothetical protein
VDRESSKSRASTAERKRAYPQGDLCGKLYVYLWADAVYFNVRLHKDRPCVLVVVYARIVR